jgi:acetyl-CoA C-acetyltransferase
MKSKTVIVGYARTPIGSFLGSFKNIKVTKLGGLVIEEVLKRSNVEASIIDEVIMGIVLSSGVGQAPARQASIQAKIDNKVSCTTINTVCGSGLKSVMIANQLISSGESNIIVAGGMENMTQSPYLLLESRLGCRMGNKRFIDSMINDGLLDPYDNYHMGVFGDLCAKKYKISRMEQDLFAQVSYKRAISATKNNIFAQEIVPVTITSNNKAIKIKNDEELLKFNFNKMLKLKASFSNNGSITAANASKISDGAAALVLMNKDFALSKGIKPIAELISTSSFFHQPSLFTTAPIFSIKKACEQIGISVDDIELFEINEAFSVVPIVAMKKLGISHKKVNVYGGAVALGHPIGCSGARILCTLLTAMKNKKLNIGCASICLGGGGAFSVIVKR